MPVLHIQVCDTLKQERFRRGDTAIHLYLKSMIIFSVETAIRQGELLAMRYDQFNFDKRTLYIPETKNGEPRTIPLSTKAIKVIQSVPRRLDGKVFPLFRQIYHYETFPKVYKYSYFL